MFWFAGLCRKCQSRSELPKCVLWPYYIKQCSYILLLTDFGCVMDVFLCASTNIPAACDSFCDPLWRKLQKKWPTLCSFVEELQESRTLADYCSDTPTGVDNRSWACQQNAVAEGQPTCLCEALICSGNTAQCQYKFLMDLAITWVRLQDKGDHCATFVSTE